jgi:pyrroline-5-carboxylate reductase
MTKAKFNITFLGCGKMGKVLLAKLLIFDKAQKNLDFIIVNSSGDALKLDLDGENITIPALGYKNIASLSEKPSNLVFIAVKPQESEGALRNFLQNKSLYSQDTVFISIVAGKEISFFEKILANNGCVKLIRAMPNILIGAGGNGLFAYYSNLAFKVDDITKSKVLDIISAFDNLLELNQEKDFSAITAIIGSGPAYIFLIQEILAQILQNEVSYLEKPLINHLISGLVIGSGMMAQNSKIEFEEMRKTVTSKKGTTESAINSLENNNIRAIIEEAIKEAIARCKELSF